MSVTIKAGGLYVTKAGEKVGPMERIILKSDDVTLMFPWRSADAVPANTDGWPVTWKDDGRFHMDDDMPCRVNDIVAEWVDPKTLPIRQVTRHEIVPGTYGRVEVGSPTGRHGVTIAVTWAAAVWNAAELRAAARVFISLAEALEQEP